MRRDDEVDPINYQPGDYGHHRGAWFCRVPVTPPPEFPGDTLGPIVLANLSKHTVTEHEDGTISAQPSILVSSSKGPLWHGYLTRGEFAAC